MDESTLITQNAAIITIWYGPKSPHSRSISSLATFILNDFFHDFFFRLICLLADFKLMFVLNDKPMYWRIFTRIEHFFSFYYVLTNVNKVNLLIGVLQNLLQCFKFSSHEYNIFSLSPVYIVQYTFMTTTTTSR